ncbi:MAG: GGDEF domain-containing protein [Oscillospiraceae bacterium]
MRLKALEAGDRYIGVFTDITQEMVEKKKIEYDRDYDIVTNLYNRRAFHERMKALFAQPEKLRVSALMMMDLDNLKYINDTYGHDYGDSLYPPGGGHTAGQCGGSGGGIPALRRRIRGLFPWVRG